MRSIAERLGVSRWMAAVLLGPLTPLLGAGGCGPPPNEDRGDEVDAPAGTGADGGTFNACPPPPTAAGPGVELAPPFDTLYSAYDLGPPPGVPSPLGGT